MRHSQQSAAHTHTYTRTATLLHINPVFLAVLTTIHHAHDHPTPLPLMYRTTGLKRHGKVKE